MRGAARSPIALAPTALVMILAVAGATRPAAADYEAGLFAFNRGDYAAAARQFEPVAREGDADAQYWLGRLYADIDGMLVHDVFLRNRLGGPSNVMMIQKFQEERPKIAVE